IEGARQAEIDKLRMGNQSLTRCLNAEVAICRELRSYYSGDVRRSCGSCTFCRTEKEYPAAFGPLLWPEESPTTTPTVEVVPLPQLSQVNARGKWAMGIRRTLD